MGSFIYQAQIGYYAENRTNNSLVAYYYSFPLNTPVSTECLGISLSSTAQLDLYFNTIDSAGLRTLYLLTVFASDKYFIDYPSWTKIKTLNVFAITSLQSGSIVR